jgi:sugar/nucleoside kinase (ribokinase family)
MEIRQEAIPVHFDFHNLTMGVNPRGERFRRPLADWRRWAFMIDTVQLNEEEIAGLGVNRMSEQETAGHLLTLGGKGVIVTRGARGATLYTNERKKIVRRDIPVEAVSGEPDTTGLGDIFGAAFLYRCVASASLVDAVTFAGAAASAAAARPRGER